MTYTLPITYMACQTCKSRVNCDDCESCLESAMMRISGIHGASVQMAKRNCALIQRWMKGSWQIVWKIWACL